MRLRLFTFLSLVVLIVFISALNSDQEKSPVLAFGVVTCNGEKVSGVSLRVFEGEELLAEMVTGRHVGYGFALDYHKQYSIEIAKEGYLRETIEIDTWVPREVTDLGDNILWEPDFEIFRLMPGLKQEEFPGVFARYKFNEELWGYFVDESYDKEAGLFVAPLLDTLRILQQDAYELEKLKADSLFSQENYEEAIIAYQQARSYRDDDKTLSDNIKTSKKLLRKQENSEEAYSRIISRADEQFSAEKYEDANQLYQKALIYKPKDDYPHDRIYAIDSIRSYQWIRKVEEYEDLLGKADTSVEEDDFDQAESYLKNASKLFPKKKHPRILMHRIDSLREVRRRVQVELAKSEEQRVTEDETVRDDKGSGSQQVDSPETRTQEMNVEQMAQIPQEAEAGLVENLAEEHEQESVIADTIREFTALPSISSGEISRPDLIDKSIEESLKILQNDLQNTQETGDVSGTSEVLEEMGQVYQSDFQHGKALVSFNESLELKREIGDKEGEVDVLSSIASVMYDSGSYQEAIDNFEQSLDLAEEIDDKQRSSEILTNIATVYENTFRFDEAIRRLEESRTLKEETGDKQGISDIHRNIGNIYFERNKFDKAAEELESSITLARELEDENEVASGLNSLGGAYYQMNQLDKAVETYEEALQITEESGNLREKSISLNNMGNINFTTQDYNKAIDYYEQSLAIKTELKFDKGAATSLYNLGNAHYKLKNYTKALEYFKASMEAAEASGYFEVVWLNYKAFARTYAALKRYKEAFENYQLYTTSKFESIGDNLQLVEMREQYESSKLAVKNLRKELQKQSMYARIEADKNRRELQIVELEVENKQQQLKRQRLVIIAFVIISLLTLVFLLIITKQFQLTRKAYRIVAEQKKNITEGINYAARIQRAVSPPDKYVQSLLPDHFILNKPCEVVGGDFYWVARHHNKVAVAVSDCTGHGVPGGFMSMLGIALLNEIISTDKQLETQDILSQLRTRVVESLHQEASGSEALDGMDITLLLMDIENRTVQFSAAYHSLYLIKDGQFKKIKGDRVPIGFHHSPLHFQDNPALGRRYDLHEH